jgi:hypothetical protein
VPIGQRRWCSPEELSGTERGYPSCGVAMPRSLDCASSCSAQFSRTVPLCSSVAALGPNTRAVLSCPVPNYLQLFFPPPEESIACWTVEHRSGGTRNSMILWIMKDQWSRGSAVGTATGCPLDGRGVGIRVPVDQRIFTSSYRPDRVWSPPNLLSNGYRGLLSKG